MLKSKIEDFKFEHIIPLRWSDFDFYGHVNNATYVTYLELARTQYFRDVCEWDFKNIGSVVAKLELDYLLPIEPRHKPTVMVRTSLVGNTSMTMESIIVQKENGIVKTVFAQARNVIVCVDLEKMRPMAIPEGLKKQIVEVDQPIIKAVKTDSKSE
ncbi:MAG: acyl-CoA thioesterase [Cyclobacteriaceae bacterium]|nr:acyl-CoA thioesterase [Cyclobacteriaceae bacterium]MCH8515764.1 acyl-CoA thioesterase [Cyclobacteriaceae bacterium]